jgi:guanylate kinase
MFRLPPPSSIAQGKAILLMMLTMTFLLLLTLNNTIQRNTAARTMTRSWSFRIPRVDGVTAVVVQGLVVVSTNVATKRKLPHIPSSMIRQQQQQHPLFLADPVSRAIHATTTPRTSNINDDNHEDNDNEKNICGRNRRNNVEPLVICGPSGVGKGSLIDNLMIRYSNLFGFSVSHTTRLPRPGEIHGKHYYFITAEEMQRQIVDGNFVEYAQVHGNFYGTSKQAIADLQRQDKITILDIDRQGVMAVKESRLPAKFIFIAPPSMQVLEERLRGRATETEEAIQRRLSNAAQEIAYGQTPGNFDHILVNDDLDETVQRLVNVLSEWYPQLSSSTKNESKL